MSDMKIQDQLEIANRVKRLEKIGFRFNCEGDAYGDWFTLTGLGATSEPVATLREAEMFAAGVVAAQGERK